MQRTSEQPQLPPCYLSGTADAIQLRRLSSTNIIYTLCPNVSYTVVLKCFSKLSLIIHPDVRCWTEMPPAKTPTIGKTLSNCHILPASARASKLKLHKIGRSPAKQGDSEALLACAGQWYLLHQPAVEESTLVRPVPSARRAREERVVIGEDRAVLRDDVEEMDATRFDRLRDVMVGWRDNTNACNGRMAQSVGHLG